MLRNDTVIWFHAASSFPQNSRRQKGCRSWTNSPLWLFLILPLLPDIFKTDPVKNPPKKDCQCKPCWQIHLVSCGFFTIKASLRFANRMLLMWSSSSRKCCAVTRSSSDMFGGEWTPTNKTFGLWSIRQRWCFEPPFCLRFGIWFGGFFTSLPVMSGLMIHRLKRFISCCPTHSTDSPEQGVLKDQKISRWFLSLKQKWIWPSQHTRKQTHIQHRINYQKQFKCTCIYSYF